MNKEAFELAYETIIGKKPSPMVMSHVHTLKFKYSYQEIFNGIWYLYVHKGLDKGNIDTYGIGLLKSQGTMEEALSHINRLARIRERAAASAEKVKDNQPEIVKIKRQKRRVHREEFDWDE